MAKTYFYNEATQDGKNVRDLNKIENGVDVLYTDGTRKQLEIAYRGETGETKQVNKLDVIAPKEVKVYINSRETFAFPAVEVLKFKGGTANLVKTVCEFENGDASDFEPNDMVEFNGTMSLKTEKGLKSFGETEKDNGFIKAFTIDDSKIQEVVEIFDAPEVNPNGIISASRVAFTCYEADGKRIGKHAVSLPAGRYSIECWGGGTEDIDKLSYCKGDIELNEETKLFLHIAGTGQKCPVPGTVEGGYNGGGLAGCGAANWGSKPPIWSGGGATDVRLIDGSWDDLASLYSRIMVAAGRGGKGTDSFKGAEAGGLIGQSNVYSSTGGSQTKGGSGGVAQGWVNGSGIIGKGGGVVTHPIGFYGGGGGSGYYGGGSGATVQASASGGSGGSSFISGYKGCDSVDQRGVHTGQPIHYSGSVFTDTIMRGSEESNVTPILKERLLGEGMIIITRKSAEGGRWLLQDEERYLTIENGNIVSLAMNEQDLGKAVLADRGFFDANDIVSIQGSLAGSYKLLTWISVDEDFILGCRFIPHPQLVIPQRDLRITDFRGIKKASLTTEGETGTIKVIVSFDKGDTWKSYENNTWIPVKANLIDARDKGILWSSLADIPEAKWAEMKSKSVRFGYYLEKSSEIDNIKVDKLVITGDMRGSWRKAIHPTDYTYEYPAEDIVTVNLLTNGSYKINYVD